RRLGEGGHHSFGHQHPIRRRFLHRLQRQRGAAEEERLPAHLESETVRTHRRKLLPHQLPRLHQG
ncbi:hypothetical protein LDENG_00051890, partial [Lucifuga dentata]